MGEKTEFEPGDNVPNDGVYMEVGEKASILKFKTRNK